jgi:protoheme IX farnesyltransferase
MVEKVKVYLLVTKPGIILGNLIAAAGGFLLAAKGDIDTGLLLSTLLGLSLLMASSCVFNNTIDRHTDRKMARTRDRALATGRLSPQTAVLYATVLGTAGSTLLWVKATPLCLVMGLAGFAVYVGLYSLYLKPNTVYSVLIGSLAGTAPPLAGYCAVTSRFDMGAMLLLIIFVLWQVPHCYAIAVFRYRDYAAAGIPVLPVKKGVPATKKRIFGYTLAFMAAASMLTFGGYTGYLYLGVAIAMSGVWIYFACSGFRSGGNRGWARRLFACSVLTITVVCVMMSIDFTTETPAGSQPGGGIIVWQKQTCGPVHEPFKDVARGRRTADPPANL